MKLLLQAGSDSQAEDAFGFVPLDHAREGGCTAAVALLECLDVFTSSVQE